MAAAPTPCLCDSHAVVCAQAMMGAKAVGIPWCARVGLAHRALDPMDRQGLVTTTPEDVMEVTIHRHVREAAVPTASFALDHRVVGLPEGQPLIDRGMGIRLAR